MREKLKKLVYRWKHRGMKEIDTLVGGFVEKYGETLTAADLEALEILLEESDNDILAWIMKRDPLPKQHATRMMRNLIKFSLQKGQK